MGLIESSPSYGPGGVRERRVDTRDEPSVPFSFSFGGADEGADGATAARLGPGDLERAAGRPVVVPGNLYASPVPSLSTTATDERLLVVDRASSLVREAGRESPRATCS